MKKQKLVPKKYAEYFYLSEVELSEILHMDPESVLSILNRLYDQEPIAGYDFEVHRSHHHYKIPADSFWRWYAREHPITND